MQTQISLTRQASQLLFLLLLATLPVTVQAEDYTHTTNNGTITITGYTGTNTVATIPDTIDGLQVTSIGVSAFSSHAELTSVTIPNGVVRIGNSSFSKCTNLTSITIPTSVTNIGSSAFDRCASLSDVMIPDGVRTIAASTFSSCASLTSITIPKSVTSIFDFAFLGCTGLTNVMISTNLTGIGVRAFLGCASLTNITIPDSVTSIGLSAFASCASLKGITVGALNPKYRSVGGVLFNKAQTSLIRFPQAQAGSYVIPTSVSFIFPEAFSDCVNLTSVTIPDNVTDIGDVAFAYCYSLTNVTISANLTGIGNYLFNFCTNLTSITIPKSVTTIGTNAFRGCGSLTDVYFRGNAPELGFGSDVFLLDNNATVYYLPGTTGWEPTFASRPTAFWVLPNPLILDFGPSFGLKTNGFGFLISWATNIPVVVEAASDLTGSNWSPLKTNTLTGGSIYFSDPQWTNYPGRFYRIRSP